MILVQTERLQAPARHWKYNPFLATRASALPLGLQDQLLFTARIAGFGRVGDRPMAYRAKKACSISASAIGLQGINGTVLRTPLSDYEYCFPNEHKRLPIRILAPLFYGWRRAHVAQ